MAKVAKVQAREILDSRGVPTIETLVMLDDGSYGLSAAPSGVSVGKYEAVELRDKDPKRFGGLGVLTAVNNVNTIIAKELVGKEATDQRTIDISLVKLDGTPNKAKLGGNAILSVSQAVCKAAAFSLKLPLYVYIAKHAGAYRLPSEIKKIPTPALNILNGGKHGAGNLDFQEFMVVPSTNKPFPEALHIGVMAYNSLRDVLIYRNAIHSVGDEGGYAPNLFTNAEAFEVIVESVKAINVRLGYDVFFGLDAAAATFKKPGGYQIKDRPEPFSTTDMVNYYKNLTSQYQLILLEDPFDQEDWQGFTTLSAELSDRLLIVGDDLISTNKERLQKAISQNAINSVLIKPNQAGTVSEILEIIAMARGANLKVIMSHRSGETNDTFVADLAVGVSSDYVKFGAPARGERVAKYNRLLEIASQLG